MKGQFIMIKLMKPIQSVEYNQGNRVIKQVWEKGENVCTLVKHSIAEKTDGINRITELRFFDDGFGRVEQTSYLLNNKGKPSEGMTVMGIIPDIVLKLGLVAANGCENNAFETIANRFLSTPNAIYLTNILKGSSMHIDMQKNNEIHDLSNYSNHQKAEYKKIISGDAITKNNDVTTFIRSCAGLMLFLVEFKKSIMEWFIAKN